MIHPELLALTGAAATIGLVHTVLGPDHYLPFIAMAKAGNWSKAKTVAITLLSGVGHVGGSVLLGALGIVLGTGLAHLEWIEAVRGDVAAWILVAFGLVYMVWGLRRAVRARRHDHRHAHADGTVHSHDHSHEHAHAHPHPGDAPVRLTPWVLFTIFVFGPCEPLIPILMYPAAVHSTAGVVLVASVFGIVTLAAMLGMVFLGLAGIRLLPSVRLERYMHPAAGAAVALTGLAVLTLGL